MSKISTNNAGWTGQSLLIKAKYTPLRRATKAKHRDFLPTRQVKAMRLIFSPPSLRMVFRHTNVRTLHAVCVGTLWFALGALYTMAVVQPFAPFDRSLLLKEVQ